MSGPTDSLTPTPDSALLQGIHQFNQPRIVGKLLHDLRNPVHSVRIAVELFSRIASQRADAGKLLEKAERYVAPAEGAVAALTAQVERLSRYLSPPLAPAIEPLAINGWMVEIAALLGESRQPIETNVESTVPENVAVLADAPRLSHAVLHWALTRVTTCRLHATLDPAGVRVRVDGAPLAGAPDGAAADTDLQRLIAQAGGACEVNEGALTIDLRRS